jgi:hypothetical protein
MASELSNSQWAYAVETFGIQKVAPQWRAFLGAP